MSKIKDIIFNAFVIYAVVHIAVGLLCIITFVIMFEFPSIQIFFHAFVLILLILAFTLILISIDLLGESIAHGMKSFVEIMLLSALSCYLSFFYILDAMSNSILTFNVSMREIIHIMPQLVNTAKTAGYEYVLIYLIVGLAIVFAAIVILYIKLYDFVADGLRRTPGVNRVFIILRGRPLAFQFLPMLVGIGILVFIVCDIPIMTDMDVLIRDPIIHSFYDAYHPAYQDADANLTRQLYQKNQTHTGRNVVIILVDSLRADHMQVYGYSRPTTPFLSRLAGTGLLHKAAFTASTCSETLCGIMSTLNSKRAAHLSTNNFRLQELLKCCGYRTYLVDAGDPYWHNLRAYYGEDFIDCDYDYKKCSLPSNDDRVAIKSLETIPEYDGTPSFFFFFLVSTHSVGKKYDEYRRWDYKEDNSIESYINKYDNSVLQADDFIRRIFDGLSEKGYIDNSIFVLAADHGEGMNEHGHIGHNKALYHEDITIPIIIYDSDRINYHGLDFATQIDIAPTIVDRVGITIPAAWEGVSLLKSTPERCTYHKAHPIGIRYAVIYKTKGLIYKYMSIENKPDQSELYELTTDPFETTNIVKSADRKLIDYLNQEQKKNMRKR